MTEQSSPGAERPSTGTGPASALASFPAGTDTLPLAHVRELPDRDSVFWDRVKATFAHEPRLYEDLLRRIHLARRRPFASAEQEACARFLACGYLVTGDVRFYNEFLWIAPRPDHPYRSSLALAFGENLAEDACHAFPLNSRENIARAAGGMRRAVGPEGPAPRKRRIALLGNPRGLAGLARCLNDAGYDARVLYLTQAERGRYYRFARRVPPLAWLYFRLKSRFLPCQTVNCSLRDPATSPALRRFGADVAFHQIGVIIRRPLMDAFDKGILNDHLGVLPFIRGRSSVAYSLLLGLPVGSTVHFVDEGIDTGPIVCWFPFDWRGRGLDSVRDITTGLIAGRDERILQTLHLLSKLDLPLLDNPAADGLQFYEMHPTLSAHIGTHIIPSALSQFQSGHPSSQGLR